MSDTPRTDALIATFKTEGNEFGWVEDLKDLCRELERFARPEAEPFAWAVFASDTHELIDVTLIKHEEPGEYAEPLYRTPQSPLVAHSGAGEHPDEGPGKGDGGAIG